MIYAISIMRIFKSLTHLLDELEPMEVKGWTAPIVSEPMIKFYGHGWVRLVTFANHYADLAERAFGERNEYGHLLSKYDDPLRIRAYRFRIKVVGCIDEGCDEDKLNFIGRKRLTMYEADHPLKLFLNVDTDFSLEWRYRVDDYPFERIDWMYSPKKDDQFSGVSLNIDPGYHRIPSGSRCYPKITDHIEHEDLFG